MGRQKGTAGLVQVGAKMEPDLREAIDRWRTRNSAGDVTLTRSMAIRLLLREALESAGMMRRASDRLLGYREGVRMGLADAKRGISEATAELWEG